MIRRPPRFTLFPYTTLSDLLIFDLVKQVVEDLVVFGKLRKVFLLKAVHLSLKILDFPLGDRKSTRLNSSHRCISYAVFCLKKKKYEPLHSLCSEYVYDNS